MVVWSIVSMHNKGNGHHRHDSISGEYGAVHCCWQGPDGIPSGHRPLFIAPSWNRHKARRTNWSGPVHHQFVIGTRVINASSSSISYEHSHSIERRSVATMVDGWATSQSCGHWLSWPPQWTIQLEHAFPIAVPFGRQSGTNACLSVRIGSMGKLHWTQLWRITNLPELSFKAQSRVEVIEERVLIQLRRACIQHSWISTH